MILQKLRWKIATTFFLVTIVASVSVEIAVGTYAYLFPHTSTRLAQETLHPLLLTSSKQELTSGLKLHNRFLLELCLDRFLESTIKGWGGEQEQDLIYDFYPRLSAVLYSKSSGNIIALSTIIPIKDADDAIIQHQEIRGCEIGKLGTEARPIDRCVSESKRKYEVAMQSLSSIGHDDVELVFLIERMPSYARYVGLIIRTWSKSYTPLISLGIFGILYGALVANWFLARFSAVSETVQQWQNGKLNARIPVQSKDELGHLSEQLNSMADELSKLTEQHTEHAVESERHRIARDLHDAVKQQVFVLSLQVGNMERKLKLHPDDEGLQGIKKTIQLIQGELALLLSELRGKSDKNQSFATLVRTQVQQMVGSSANILCQVRIDCDKEPSSRARLNIIRILQEALANCIRHSGATEVTVEMSDKAGRVRMSVHDNGIGFDSTTVKSGMGLQSIQERVATLTEGAVTIESSPNTGTTIIISYKDE